MLLITLDTTSLKPMKLKTPDEIARHFKLHNCVGNPRFAKQIEFIQDNAIQAEREKVKQLKPKA